MVEVGVVDVVVVLVDDPPDVPADEDPDDVDGVLVDDPA